MHFVYVYIFPIEKKGIEFRSFNSYYKDEFQNGSISKHQVTISLVEEFLPQISAEYRWLHDQSMSTRYTNAPIKKNRATKALKYLEKVKDVKV